MGIRVIEASVEKKGNNKAFTYTHKLELEKAGQKMLQKRAISAAEYIDIETNRRDDMKTLRSTRICTMDQCMYMIIDWYDQVDGQPLTCIVQVNQEELRNSGARIKLPSYLQIAKDISDLEEFKPRSLARADYKMDPEILKLTQSE